MLAHECNKLENQYKLILIPLKLTYIVIYMQKVSALGAGTPKADPLQAKTLSKF